MNHREQLRPLDFDEQRALEHLQQLHRDILRARDDRENAQAEFETFVRGFEAPEQSEPAESRRERAAAVVGRESRPQPPAVHTQAPPEPAPSAVARDTRPEPPPVGAAPSPQVRGAEAAAAPAPSQASLDAPAPAPGPSRSRRRGLHPAVGIGIAAVVLAGVVWAMLGRGAGSNPVRDVSSDVAAPASVPAPTPAVQPGAADAAAHAAEPPASGIDLEMTTRRTVWVRVTIDGRRTIERELPGGERIPLRGAQSIVIRAGDGGAVSVRRGGQDTRLGEDGFPITRTFAVERRADGPAARQP